MTSRPPGDYDFRRALKLSSNYLFHHQRTGARELKPSSAWASDCTWASAPGCSPARKRPAFFPNRTAVNRLVQR